MRRLVPAVAAGAAAALLGWPLVAAQAPSPAAIALAPSCGPLASPLATRALQYSITVQGTSFNPFQEILVTFDAGVGGRPQSFGAVSDGFGSFSTVIQPAQRPAGAYVVRADDFRERVATATFTVPCPSTPVTNPPPGANPPAFAPVLQLDPAIGPPGFVTQALGTGFPPGQAVVLGWDQGILGLQAPQPLVADANGSFQVPILIFHHDMRGKRTLTAQPGGDVKYNPASADFLVVPGSQQPADLVLRR